MLLLPLMMASLAVQDPAWRYVVPPLGSEYRCPAPTALPLTTQRPEELEVTVQFDGNWQRYGSLRLGDSNSTRLAVVLDHRSATEAVLYVDRNRDLSIDARDLVPGDGPDWELSLAVASRDADGRPLLTPRRMAFQLGATGAILGVSTLGWLEGQVTVGEQSLRARRRDGDGNGFFDGPTDQLWIDRDGSGEFDPLHELFVVRPVLVLGKQRLALRSDRLGERLTLERLDGSGTVRPVLRDQEGAVRFDVEDLQALLVGRGGSAILIHGPGPGMDVPVGEYRISMVIARLEDPDGGTPWNYNFAEAYDVKKTAWRAVVKDADHEFDVLGLLQEKLWIPSGEQDIKAGSRVTLWPGLLTQDHLIITTAYRGHRAPVFSRGGLVAQVSLVDETDKVIGEANSGFA